MATRSTIAVVNPDNTVDQIYCHWDGYIDNNGKILLEHYTDYNKIKELIDLGSISQLEKNVNPSTESHAFNNAEPDVVVAYHRDRGEDKHINHFNTLTEFYDEYQGEEFNYLWNGEWLVQYDTSDWNSVQQELKKDGKL